VIFSVVYLVVRCLLGCLMVRARLEVAKDAGLLVVRHEIAVLGRQIGRVRYQPADRLWLAALSRLIPRQRWGEVFAVTPATQSPAPMSRPDRTRGDASGPHARNRVPGPYLRRC
jgi:putative transposase